MSEYRKGYREFQREYFWTLPRVVFAAALGVASLGAVGFGVRYIAYQSEAFYAPRMEGVRRDTMIQSRAYGEATIRQLYTLKRQYEAAQDQDQKDTIRLSIIHESDAFDKRLLPLDLRTFLAQIGG